LLGDLFKCVLAMLIVKLAFGGTYQDHIALLTMYGAAGCILGHNFPFFLRFKGGKGVACSVGMAAVFDWRILLICAVVFFTLFFWKHYVSLCSLTVYAVALILVIVFGQMGSYHMSPSYNYELYILMALLTALCYYRHRANISRLIKGTESKIFLSKKN
ncbi:MAG: glycerol-3-phosphate acyltransferase, partial [Clostridiales bacterium]|nr:glycerol-3-phosphate acyltransferase [Candidatus Blautia equi]